MNQPLVSIRCLAYNHEKYIRKCLDSIVMQKTNFAFEVIVHDDASSDNTANIIRDYAAKYPEKIVPVIEDENVFSKHDGSLRRIMDSYCRGEFIATCECDDYWVDPYKLQKQVDFLLNNPDYFAVAHRCIVVGEDNELLEEEYPDCKKQEYSIEDFANDIYPGQTASLVHRNLNANNIDLWLINKNLYPADRIRIFTYLCHGKIRCFSEKMSAYRHILSHGASFSATHKYSFENERIMTEAMVTYSKHFSNKSIQIYANLMWLLCIRKAWQKHVISCIDFIKYLKFLDFKIFVLFLLFKRDMLKLLNK